MRKFLISALALFVLGVIFTPYTAIAGPAVVAHIDKGKQTMRVSVNGRHMYTWKVSTAAYSFHTPSGSYRPKRMHTMWRSRKYHNSPMPHSIFFKGGYAVHGTGSVSRLGRPASHGCVRLHPANAKKLFNLVRQHGMANSRISLSGAYPYSKADRKYGKAVRYADAHPHVRKKKKRRAAKKKRSRRTVRTASRGNFFEELFNNR
jgi:hypothetical protein